MINLDIRETVNTAEATHKGLRKQQMKYEDTNEEGKLKYLLNVLQHNDKDFLSL